MAAIQTTLTLKDDISKRLKTIEKRVRSLAKTMDNFNKGIVTSGKRMNTLSTNVNKVANSTKKLGTAVKDVDRLNKSLKDTKGSAFSAKSGVDGLTQSVKRLAAAYIGMVGIGGILDTADKITASTNKLATVYRMENPTATDADTKAVVEGQLDDIFASAQRSRSGYTDTVQNVGKMLINAGDVFNGNLDKAIAFNELMAKSYTIGGASDKEQSSSMYQLIQAMGAGILAGDELRSVREGAQVAYKYIEEYAQALYNTKTSLKDLASEGLITSEIVANAILKNADAINAMFDDTQVTFEQTWTMMKNNFVKAFEPVLQQLTTVLNNDDFQEMLTGLTSAFVGMANLMIQTLDWLSEKWNQVNGYVQENADLISQVLIPVIGAVISAWMLWTAWTLIQSVIANWQIYLIILAIVALVSALIWLVSKFEWAGQFIGGLIGFIISFIWNLIVGLVNAIWQIVVTLYNFIAGIVNSVATMFANGAEHFLDGLARFAVAIIGIIVDACQIAAKLIDALFGSDLDTKLQSFQDNLNDKLKAEGVAETIIIEPLKDANPLEAVGSEWIEKGVEIGGTIHEKLSGANDWFKDKLATGTNPFGGNDWETTIGNALDGSGTGENIGNIADSIELTKEDLEFLRELAEMEAINKFTTAEIKVDMSNYNTISGENDLDGLVVKLSEKIEEEMHIVAEGTY